MNRGSLLRDRGRSIDKPVIKVLLILGKSVKVSGMSKQIGLVQNTDCQKRPNIYYVIDIGCSLNKMRKKHF